MLGDINVPLVSCLTPLSTLRSPGSSLNSDWPLSSLVMSSGVDGLDQGILSQNIGEDKACSMCARWILLITPDCAPLAGLCLGELFVFQC